MSEQSSKKGTMAKDTIIYMMAKGIEGVVGIVTMSVMTYLFVASQMGRYSTVNIAITTVGMVAIQWLVQSVLRYINKYDLANEQESFFTTVTFAWLKVNGIVILGVALLIAVLRVLSGNIPAVAKFLEVYNIRLLIIGGLWFVTYNTAQLMIAMLAATRQAKLNLVLSLITVVGKLTLMYAFCKLYGSRIEWVFLSYFIIDGIVSIVGIWKLKIFKFINKDSNSNEILTELKDYGMPLMGNMITTSVLNKSDIYIITILISDAAAGIYQTNYSLVATAFTLLSASIMRGSYPTIVRTWSEGKKELTEKLVGEAVRFYLLVAVPAVVGVATVSDVMAKALFQAEYYEGNTIMVWVALGMMFLGLTEYSIKPWELNANTTAIFKRSLIGGIINVALNLIFIKVFESYYVASVTTFIGFFAYFLLARLGTRKYMKWHLHQKVYYRIIISAFLMGAFIMTAKQFIPYGRISLCLLILAGMVVYALALYISGEVKSEAQFILKKIVKK